MDTKMIRFAHSTMLLALAAGWACVPAEARGDFVASLDPVLAREAPACSVLPGAAYPTRLGAMLSDDAFGVGPAAACFHPDTPPTPEQLDAINRLIGGGDFAPRFNLGVRWSGTNGDPQTISYSFVPDGTMVPGLSGPDAASTLFATLDAQFASNGGRARWIGLVEQVFARWSSLTGITYIRVSASGSDADDGAAWGSGEANTRGMVRISMRTLDGINGVLGFNSFPPGGDMVLDANENWASSGGSWIFMRNILAHEHGHGLGFAHVCPINLTKLMEPTYTSAFDGPQHDDILAGHAFYGDFYERNDTGSSGTLVDPSVQPDQQPLPVGFNTILGNMPAPALANTSILSIDPNNDDDYYRFMLDRARLLTVTLTPLGQSYASYTQTGNCNNTTVNTNSLAAANLAFDIRSSTGASVYAAVNNAVAGQPETTSDVLCPAGLNTVRVYRSGAQAIPQMYRLTLRPAATTFTLSASDGTSPSSVELAWTGVPNATQYQIQRSTANNQPFASIIASVDAPATTYSDTSAQPGTTYYYWVRAVQNGLPKLITDDVETGFAGQPACVADVDDGTATGTPDGGVTVDDLLYYLTLFGAGDVRADVDDGTGTNTRDQAVTIDDLLYYLARFELGC